MKSFSQFTDKITVTNPKHVLRELTVSPHYKNRNGFNPYYVLDIDDKEVKATVGAGKILYKSCLLYTSPSPRDAHESRMPSSA